MATNRQIKRISTNPAAYARFITSGKLPESVRPSSPLITLLEQLSPHDRQTIRGLTVDPRLGYSGSRMFSSAEAALRWAAPSQEMVEGEPWPAESWRIKAFAVPLFLEDLLQLASSHAPGIHGRYPRLRAPARPGRPQPDDDNESGDAPEPAPRG